MIRVGVVGATGMVGRVLLETLERRRFPAADLRPFGSGRAGAAVRFRGRRLRAPAPTEGALRACDLVFLVSSDEVSRRYGRALARGGAWVIDDSSAFRMSPDVPLVIPEVNGAVLSPRRRLVAGPNCTVTGIAVAGWPLHRAVGVRGVRVASYQAVSGAGRLALEEFYGQARRIAPALRSAEALPRPAPGPFKAFPAHIAFNLLPQVGAFDARGDCGEEVKVREELRKLWGAPGLQVSAITVRVPVARGHSLAAWVETRRPLTPARARSILRRAGGLRLWEEGAYPTPLIASGTEPVHVGRLRSGAGPRELALWVVSDNLLKGAALNSVQIAELLLKKGWLRRAG